MAAATRSITPDTPDTARTPDSDTLIRRQMDAIGALAGVGTRLGAPTPNNFVLVLNAASPPTCRTVDWAEITRPLNVADDALLAVCRRLLDNESAMSAIPSAVRGTLAGLLEAWQFHVGDGSNLVGCLYAGQFAEQMGAHLSLCDVVRTQAPHVARLFVDVPPVIRELVRINIYLPMGATTRALGLLLGLDRETGVLDHVDRVEVAKHLRDDLDWAVPGFPTLMLYLGVTPERRPGTEALAALLGQLRGLFADLPVTAPYRPSVEEFALPWARNANITQSFRLYKRYLRTVGMLDEVFDVATNHALVRRDRAVDTAVCDAVRALLRT